jgi:hypothetical protein
VGGQTMWRGVRRMRGGQRERVERRGERGGEEREGGKGGRRTGGRGDLKSSRRRGLQTASLDKKNCFWFSSVRGVSGLGEDSNRI